MPRRTVLFTATLTVLLSATPALAARSDTSGIELGFRTGYAFSAGNLGAPPNGSDHHVSDYVSGQWPFWFDAGYRFNPSIYFGAYFSYGVGFVNDDKQDLCRQSSVDCSASDVKFGFMGRYHPVPDWQVSPWIGYGIGWEWASYSAHGSPGGSFDSSWSGVEFANLQIGGDIHLARRMVIAPFASFSFGRFDSRTETVSSGPFTETSSGLGKESVHEWIFLGVRIAFAP